MEKPDPYKTVLLSFDVEEFDAPADFGAKVSSETYYTKCEDGLSRLMPVLSEIGIPATFYLTADWAEHAPDWVSHLSRDHEIGSHTWYHSRFSVRDLLASRQLLQRLSGQEVKGLRMPRMQEVSASSIKAAGYTFDSSLNPTWIPGRYNHFRTPRTLQLLEEGLWELPVSVTPVFRIPLFWLSFHVLPLGVLKVLARRTLNADGVLHLYFHPWEFSDLASCGLPAFLVRSSGPVFLKKVETFLRWLSRNPAVRFERSGDWLQKQASRS